MLPLPSAPPLSPITLPTPVTISESVDTAPQIEGHSSENNTNSTTLTSAVVKKTYAIHDYQKLKIFLEGRYVRIEQPYIYCVKDKLFVKKPNNQLYQYRIRFLSIDGLNDSRKTIDCYDRDMYSILTNFINNMWPTKTKDRYGEKHYYNHPDMSGVTLHLYDVVRRKIVKEPIRTLSEFKSAILFIETQNKEPLDDSVSLFERNGHMNETFHFILSETPEAEKARLDMMNLKLNEEYEKELAMKNYFLKLDHEKELAMKNRRLEAESCCTIM